MIASEKLLSPNEDEISIQDIVTVHTRLQYTKHNVFVFVKDFLLISKILQFCEQIRKRFRLVPLGQKEVAKVALQFCKFFEGHDEVTPISTRGQGFEEQVVMTRLGRIHNTNKHSTCFRVFFEKHAKTCKHSSETFLVILVTAARQISLYPKEKSNFEAENRTLS